MAELTGDDQGARALFEEVLRLQPGQALATWRLRSLAEPTAERREARRELGTLLLEVRYETSLQLASQAIGEDDPVRAETILNDLPKDLRHRPRVLILRGAIHELRGDLEGALEKYWSAFASDEIRIRRIAALQWVRALRLKEQNRWETVALKRYRSKSDPTLALAIGLGIAEQDVTRAVDYFSDRISEYDADPELRYRLGVLYEQQGQRERALAQMEATIERDGQHADALNFLGYSLAEAGKDLVRAEQLIRAALALKPKAGYIMDSLGWVLFQQGNADEALPWLQKALELEGADPIILEHLGDALAVLGRDEEARASYREALRIVEDLGEAKRLREKILKTRD